MTDTDAEDLMRLLELRCACNFVEAHCGNVLPAIDRICSWASRSV